MPGMKFSQEKINEANRLYDHGRSLRYIATELGTTKKTVIRHLRNYVPPSKVDYATLADEMVERYQNGATIQEVAREMGISHATVVKYLPRGIATLRLKTVPNEATEKRWFDESACDPDVLEYLTLRAVDEDDYTLCLKRLCTRYGLSQKEALETYFNWRHDYVRRLMRADKEEEYGELESDFTGEIFV